MTEYTIKGIALAECSLADLRNEWEAGMDLDCTEGLTKEQSTRMVAVEREIDRREQASI